MTTVRIILAAVAFAAGLLIAGCGGHPAPAAMSYPKCHELTGRVQALLTKEIEDGVNGKQLAASIDQTAAHTFWVQIHRGHCPAASYAQLGRFLNELG